MNSYNFDVGDNITVTDDFSVWLEDIQKENLDLKEKIKQIAEMIDFYNNYNVDEIELIENIEKVVKENE